MKINKTIAEIKALHRKAVVAQLDIEAKLGRIESEIEKFESLRPLSKQATSVTITASSDAPEGPYVAFRLHDLILAGIDVSKYA